MVELAENGEGALPLLACGRDVRGAMVGITEVYERLGFAVTITGFLPQDKTPLEALDGLLMPAELGIGETERVERGRFGVSVGGL